MATAQLTLRPMTEDDLATFRGWLGQPHFARWFLQDATAEHEVDERRASLAAGSATHALMAELDGRAVAWTQWYRWADYPDEAMHYDALPGEVGIDYGIGDPADIGRGIGTALIEALVLHVRRVLPGAGVLVGPSAANAASCRVLEKNGFTVVDVRDLPGEPNASPLALYRLASE